MNNSNMNNGKMNREQNWRWRQKKDKRSINEKYYIDNTEYGRCDGKMKEFDQRKKLSEEMYGIIIWMMIKRTGNTAGNEGAIKICESLMMNTTLTSLNLRCMMKK